jgi:hypothetical protein
MTATTPTTKLTMTAKDSNTDIPATTTSTTSATSSQFPIALQSSKVTLLGYGALMSESSSKLTFPQLTNFRHVKVKKMRRVFAHPHIFLLNEGIIDIVTDTDNDTDADRDKDISTKNYLKLASLSVEPVDNEDVSFIAVAFDVTLDDEQRTSFMEREKEYEIVSTPYYPCKSSTNNDNITSRKISSSSSISPSYNDNNGHDGEPLGEGVICIASNDLSLMNKNIEIPDSIKDKGGIWHWPHDSGLLPANIYLRHCLLALRIQNDDEVEKTTSESAPTDATADAYESFLHDTYLADRETTLATYLKDHYDEVMSSRPPPHLATRFGG